MKKEEKIMFCKNCGNKLPDTASFCPECGIKVKKEESKTSTENKKITNISNGLETRVERIIKKIIVLLSSLLSLL